MKYSYAGFVSGVAGNYFVPKTAQLIEWLVLVNLRHIDPVRVIIIDICFLHVAQTKCGTIMPYRV